MKLALGTAQFGLGYGIANVSGQVPLAEIRNILSRARNVGIDTIDTAVAYGESEAQLGYANVTGLRVVSKLPALGGQSIDLTRLATASLERLNISRLHGLLLHRSQDLVGPNADGVYDALQSLKHKGLTLKIGVSIYDPSELEPIADRFDLDLVQAPYNVLDRRIASSGWLARLVASGVEVHVRSAFLQGLLLMSRAQRPVFFARWSQLLDRWDEWLADTRQSPLAAAIGFASGSDLVDRVVVGVDSCSQLEQILEAAKQSTEVAPAYLATNDTCLINPANWIAS